MAELRNKGKRINQYVRNYVVFDLETTGINPVSDEIIEIAAVKVRDGSIVGNFSSLVNPGIPIPAGATAVNGITNQMVADAPKLNIVLKQFLDFIGGDILVGHNIHTFDLKFILKSADTLFGIGIHNDYVDTLFMARACLPMLKHHRLSDVSNYFQISTEGAHRALCDCIMNQGCYERLGKMMGEKTVLFCPKCGGELRERKGKFGAFYGCSNFPECRFTKNI